MTLLISGSDFAVNSISIPVIRKFNPVNFLREFSEKLLRHSGFSDVETASKAQKSRITLLFSLRTGKYSIETGSHMTAHTTIQSSRTAETVSDQKQAVSAGILDACF
jgi:hypothetical protein